MFRLVEVWPVADRVWRVLLLIVLSGVRPVAAAFGDEAPAAPGEVPTVAVLDFVDKGPSVELAPLRTALAEMLSVDLAQYEGVRVAERVRVDQFLREAHLEGVGVDAANVQRAAQALAARYLVTGSFGGMGQTVTIETSLFEVGRDQPLAVWKESVSVGELIRLEETLVQGILAALGIDSPRRRGVPPPKPGPSPSVAVLAFRNLSPSVRLAPMESGFADVLQANLGALEDVRLVEREQIYAVLAQQSLSLSGLVDPETALKVGRLVGADRLIYGSFVELAESLRFNVRLADTKTASILRAETIHGPTEDFALLIEDLALRLAADLAVQPPPDAAELVSAATPIREIEAAIHYADAERLYHLGRYAESARSWERVALIEPDNVFADYQRLRSWYAHKEYQRAIEAGEQALAKCTSPSQAKLKSRILGRLSLSYEHAGKYDEAVRINRQQVAEFPNTAILYGTGMAYDLLLAGRRDEAIAMLEKIVEDEKKGGNYWRYVTAVGNLYMYLHREAQILQGTREHQSRKRDRDYMAAFSARSRETAKRRMEIFDLALEEAKGKNARTWRTWANNWALHFPLWVDEENINRGYLTEAEQEEYLTKVLDTFSWNRELVQKGQQMLAELRQRQGKWDEALQAARSALERANDLRPHGLPDSWDQARLQRTEKIDKIIEARFQIADIYHTRLGDLERAKAEYHRLVEEFGLAHLRGVHTALALQELGEEIRFPQKGALVWGGSYRVRQAWAEILRPMGFAVHHVGQYDVSAAHLAPYRLLILVRTGMLPYAPEDVLAIRHFVAAGGSLLVVVSPGWEHGAPGIHNALLSFFGARAEGEMTVRAESTRIVPHPITEGTEQAMAKNAVHLQVPAEAALIEADGRTVLAAIEYRHGRVVLASFGQWFLPDPEMPVSNPPMVGPHWSTSVPPEDLPLEVGPTLHLPLLRNAVSWLVEPHPEGGGVSAVREQFAQAQRVSLAVQFRTASRGSLEAAMEKLIASVGPGIWKEEALWAAGESSLRQTYYIDSFDNDARYGRLANDDSDVAVPDYYRRLIREFPDSALCPYAQWRLAGCAWHKWRNSGWCGLPSDPREVVKRYQDVRAPEGSYPWAWTQLHLGETYFHTEDFAKALTCFREVADRMDHGPEKSMALVNVATCYRRAENLEEAERYYKIARAAPDVYWGGISRTPYSVWSPLKIDGTHHISPTKKIAQTRLRTLQLNGK